MWGGARAARRGEDALAEYVHTVNRVSESAVRLNLRGRAADGKHGAVAVINSNSNLEHLE